MSKELIRLTNLTMTFEDGETILDNINLYINNKEFLTLLGPSGCGKTTMLRIIGGFLTPTSGDVLFNGKRINALPAYQRKINTVFQRYALFPHLDVYDNIAFGLRIAKVKEDEIDERVTEMLEIVSLKGFENRKVTRLSGGQQQRVAIARALVNRPQVLLLDEPLGALDLRLRKDMQNELKNIQQRMGITFIYVTHDQEEALTMSDTIVVMNKGKIQQIGRPEDIYNEPKNAFVADFIGESNILDGVMLEDYVVKFFGRKFQCVDKGFAAICAAPSPPSPLRASTTTPLSISRASSGSFRPRITALLTRISAFASILRISISCTRASIPASTATTPPTARNMTRLPTPRRKKPMKNNNKLLACPYIIWMVLFTIIPLGIVVYYALTDSITGQFTLSNLSGMGTYLPIFLRSIWLSLFASLICLIIGYPVAYFIAQCKPLTQRFLEMLIMLPMCMSFLLRTLAWVGMLEDTGIINTLLQHIGISPLPLIRTNGAVILGMVYNYLPYMILPLYTVIMKIDNRLVEAALDLGCRPSQVFSRVILPLSGPGILSGLTMVFVPAVSTFYISQKLGSTGTTLIGDVIESQFKTAYNPNLGAAMSLVLMILIFICVAVMNRFGEGDGEEVIKV